MSNKQKAWTFAEDELLRELAFSGTAPHRIAVELRRTETAVRSRAAFLKLLLRTPGRRRNSICGYG